MASPEIKLEEQLIDVRSNQIAYKLTVYNSSAESISILGLQPNVPIGAQLLEITDNESAEDFSKKAELILELNNLLDSFLWVESEDFRANLITVQAEAFKSIFSFSGFFQAYTSIIFRRGYFETQIKRRVNSFQYKIASGGDAHHAYDTWLDTGPVSFVEPRHKQKGIKVLFQAKLAQLDAVESRLQESLKGGSSLTSVEPGSSFSATYVLRFDRSLLEPKKYQVGFNVRYKIAGGDIPQSASVATNLQISPSPLSLSIVAIVSALLGAMLRGSLGGDANKFNEIIQSATTGQIIIGPIVALVFFNIYEHTSLGKELSFSISWRSALLIGALCGLAQDRVIAALTALIGV
ncbi:hypothetical protein ACM9HO_03990 [Pseudomonas sp. KHB2.9]